MQGLAFILECIRLDLALNCNVSCKVLHYPGMYQAWSCFKLYCIMQGLAFILECIRHDLALSCNVYHVIFLFWKYCAKSCWIFWEYNKWTTHTCTSWHVTHTRTSWHAHLHQLTCMYSYSYDLNFRISTFLVCFLYECLHIPAIAIFVPLLHTTYTN